MKRDRPRSELLIKRDDRLLEDAREFLSKQAGRPSPEWYARLLDEHGEEIAAVIAWWLSQVQDQLAVLEWWQWTDPLLWMELEASLARRLAPVLRRAVQAAARRQAVEQDEPIPVRLADAEAALWAEQEAQRQAALIARETHVALLEAAEALELLGLSGEERRRVILEGGLFALNRRFAGAAVRSYEREGLAGVIEHGQRLLAVRQELIVTQTAVSSVAEGIILAALFWQREGRLVTKMWRTQEDEKVCPICGSMNVQEVPLRSFFVASDGSYHERPPAHHYCRCFLQIFVRSGDVFDFGV